MDSDLHRLLQRQISRSELDLLDTPEGEQLVKTINKTYIQFEKERKILEESARHMLGKIVESNENLQTIITSLDGFNYHVSHDLKNSMINTLSLSKMTRKYFQREDYRKVEEVVNKLIDNTENGLELVDKFLKISKMETKLVDKDETLLNLIEIAGNAISHLNLEKKLDLVIKTQEFTSLHGKEPGFSSLFQNLFSNAYKYRRQGVRPTIELSLLKNGNERKILIADNGIGIDLEKNKDKLFKPFTRLNNVSTQEGTGVGLFLVKKVVVMHGGSITIESTPNEGTTFILTF